MKPQSSQQKLKEALFGTEPFLFDNPQAKKIHRVIVEMICVDCLPFYTVKKPGFLYLVKVFTPKYIPCSCTYLS